MTEENTPSTEPEVVSLEDTIESLAAEFQVQPAAAPAQEHQPAQPSVNPFVPDPLDADQFKTFIEGQNKTVTALESQIRALNEKVSQQEREKINSQVKTEVAKAVDKVGKDLGFPERMIKAHLEGLADENPNFMRIWQNRASNPKALDKALQAIRADIKNTWVAVNKNQDIIENQQAARTSQQAMATKSRGSTGNDLQDRLDAAKTPAERDRIWAQAVSSGSL